MGGGEGGWGILEGLTPNSSLVVTTLHGSYSIYEKGHL